MILLHEFYLNSFMPLNLWKVNLWCKSEFLLFYILFDFLIWLDTKKKEVNSIQKQYDLYPLSIWTVCFEKAELNYCSCFV